MSNVQLHVKKTLSSSIFAVGANTVVWKALYFIIPCDLLFHFRQPNLGCPATDLAEIMHTD